MRNSEFSKHKLILTGMLAGFMLPALGTLAVSQVAHTMVSQKGRAFAPSAIAIKRGETVTIVNDDADLSHHVYISASNFSFDSGDQKPGSKVSIAFPATGSFEVLCAIHPKMKLAVKVE